ncbi:MAG: L,D-transpeptidase [bacterium]
MLPRRLIVTSLVLCLGSVGCGRDRKKQRKVAPGGGSGGGKAEAGLDSVRSSPELRARLRLSAKVAPPPAQEAPGEGPRVLHEPGSKGSYRAIRPVAVFQRPTTAAPIVGTVAKFTRLPRVRHVAGADCPGGFLELGASAYVCRKNLRVDRRPPQGKRQPTQGSNGLTPGTYGYIRTGGAKRYWTLEDGFHDRNGKPIEQSDTVRWAGKRFFQGMKFWRITTGYFLRGDRVRRFWPSHMKGVDLRTSKLKLPLVFMASRRRRRIGEKIPPVDVHQRPRGKVVSTLERYSAWPTDDAVQGKEFRWYRVPGKGWVSSEMVRLARVTDPPQGLHPAERWIDVDLEEQTLVAYRGRTPVYAALIGAGVWKYPTPTGVFRIYKKVAEADMKSEAKASEQYRVDHVPWTMYFQRGYALHGAYWHDGFGHARSHGCVNLSPRDARAIYEFTRPVVPDGWTSLRADEDHPGTAVRIRGKAAAPKPPKDAQSKKKPESRPAAMPRP